MSHDLLERTERRTAEDAEAGRRPPFASLLWHVRPALLAGEEHDQPDRHVFRGID